VKAPATVAGHDRLRLFCALRLPRPTVKRIAAWQAEALSDGRVVVPEHLHMTLAFLGARPAGDLSAIAAELRAAANAAVRPVLRLRGYRETRSVGMLVLQDEGRRATAFATDVHARLERLGVYRRERRQWLPHVTVLRFRERPYLRPELPDLGEVSLSEAAVYHSVLRPTGAQYEILEAVALGG
jgi:RNA 2',3'-cyclic 3'-phosphodiesterase